MLNIILPHMDMLYIFFKIKWDKNTLIYNYFVVFQIFTLCVSRTKGKILWKMFSLTHPDNYQYGIYFFTKCNFHHANQIHITMVCGAMQGWLSIFRNSTSSQTSGLLLQGKALLLNITLQEQKDSWFHIYIYICISIYTQFHKDLYHT